MGCPPGQSSPGSEGNVTGCDRGKWQQTWQFVTVMLYIDTNATPV